MSDTPSETSILPVPANEPLQPAVVSMSCALTLVPLIVMLMVPVRPPSSS